MSWTQCPMGSELNVTGTLAGNTAEISGVAAEAVELAMVIEEDRSELVCFSYSSFGVGSFVDVLSCSGLGLLTLHC